MIIVIHWPELVIYIRWPEILSYLPRFSSDILINLFIILYLFVAWCWDLPETSLEYRLVNKFRRVILWLGLYHCWKMFGPDPARADRHLQASVLLKDGSTANWTEPLLAKMGLFKALLYGRHRKWKFNLLSESNKHLMNSYANYLSERDFGGQVRSMTFFDTRLFVPPPGDAPGNTGKIERVRLFDYLSKENQDQ